MGPRIRFVFFVLVALVAAAVLALLADGVFSVERSMSRPPEAGSDQPSRALRVRVAESLLGTSDDRRFQEALGLFAQTRASTAAADLALAQRGELEVTLTELVSGDGGEARRARAANLKGVLLYEDSTLDQASAERYLELALASFREAARLDPENEDAKANLELLVNVLRERRGELEGRAGSSGSSGAGAAPEGSGY